MSFDNDPFPYLPPRTIVPNPVDDTENFMYFINRFYEDAAESINVRKAPYFQIQISTTAQNIPFLPRFGAFILCVSGEVSSQPVKTYSLVKADQTAAGQIDVLGTQAGTGAWAGFDITITSTTTNFQIAHNGSQTATFNIRWIGTQI